MRPKHALAIVALTTTLVSCSAQTVPASTPTLETESLRLYATTATAPLVNDLTFAYSDSFPNLRFSTRSANYESLLDDLRSDVIAYFLSNHLPADSPLWAAPIGQDAIVMVAHADTRVFRPTLEQIHAIYRGRITRWSEIGGADMPVSVISREHGAGTRAEFERQVMGQTPTTANAIVAPSSDAMLQAVRATPGSIGYVSMGFLRMKGASGLNILAVEGVMPTPETVFDSTYPLRSTLFVVGLEEPQASYRAFIGWMQSPAGQTIIRRHYAPLNN